MEVRLVITRGKANKSEILVQTPTVLGRSREADLTVSHPMISRQHCELFEVDGLLMIRDRGSLNGTLLGRRRLVEAPLKPRDEFTIGPLTFRAEYEYAGDLDAIPAPRFAPLPDEGPPDDEDAAAAIATHEWSKRSADTSRPAPSQQEQAEDKKRAKGEG